MVTMLILTSIVISFLLIKYILFKFTTNVNFPPFLDYQPYNCYKCIGFWTLTFIYITIAVCTHEWLYLIGNGLTLIDTIALILHERKNNQDE